MLYDEKREGARAEPGSLAITVSCTSCWSFVVLGQSERALPYALVAGDEAGEVYAYAEAEHHYRRALQLAEEVGDLSGEARALRSLGEALAPTGRYEEALDALEGAADGGTRQEDR